MKITLDIRVGLDRETDLENALPELQGDLQSGIAEVIKDLMRWRDVEISIAFVIPGSEKQNSQCQICHGIGYFKTNDVARQCWFCKGVGYVNKSDIMTGVCPECDGRGKTSAP